MKQRIQIAHAVKSAHSRTRAFQEPLTRKRDDVRGFLVFDCLGRKIGTVCEIYCDKNSMQPRYLEIISLEEGGLTSAMCPYDFVKTSHTSGFVAISLPGKYLFAIDDYNCNHVMQTEGHEIVVFDEVIGGTDLKLAEINRLTKSYLKVRRLRVIQGGMHKKCS